MTKTTMTNQIIGAIALDLKRAAMGSLKVSKTFLLEAINKKKDVNDNLPTYIQKIMMNLQTVQDKEDLLMYSTLLQNYSIQNG